MDSRQHSKLVWLLVLLSVFVGGSLIFLTSLQDVAITKAVSAYAPVYGGLIDFANRSVFQSDAVGLSDMPIFFIIGIFLFLLLAPFASRFFFITPRQLVCANFILLSASILSAVVHLLKGVISRPRPYSVDLVSYAEQSQQFLWPVNWTFDAWGKGSFPSGHTASMVGMLVVMFTVKSLKAKLLWLFTILPSIIWMAFSRIAVQAHWASDTLASFLIGIFTIFFVDRFIFRLDERLRICDKTGITSPRSGFTWEWKLFPALLLVMISPFFPVFLYRMDLPLVLIFVAALLAFFVIRKLSLSMAVRSKKHLDMLRSNIR